jgi:hypothetical protein
MMPSLRLLRPPFRPRPLLPFLFPDDCVFRQRQGVPESAVEIIKLVWAVASGIQRRNGFGLRRFGFQNRLMSISL